MRNKCPGTWDKKRQLTKVNDLEKLRSSFYLLSLGALRGLSPAEGEAEKPQALKCGGDLPHILINYVMVKLCAMSLDLLWKYIQYGFIWQRNNIISQDYC
jgi:hypothetical protein